jgi:hypothetical protein
MTRIAALLLAALAGCATSRAPIPGLRTELTLLDPSPAVGGPLRVRLTLINEGPERVVFMPTPGFSLRGPDGALPYIDGPRSKGFSGDYPRIEAGGRLVLVEEQDLAELYLVSKPGRLTISTWGGLAWARRERDYSPDEDPWTRDEPEYPSELAVEIRPGPLPLKTDLAARLHPLTPKDWHFACDWWPGVEGPDVSFLPPDIKSGIGRLRVRVHDGPALKGEVRLTEFRSLPVYLHASGKAETLWPDWRERVKEVLVK